MKKTQHPHHGVISKFTGLLMFLLFSASLITQSTSGTVLSGLSVNTTNVNAAITSQGPDVLSIRIRWDK